MGRGNEFSPFSNNDYLLNLAVSKLGSLNELCKDEIKCDQPKGEQTFIIKYEIEKI